MFLRYRLNLRYHLLQKFLPYPQYPLTLKSPLNPK
jgi:hypothetical protein